MRNVELVIASSGWPIKTGLSRVASESCCMCGVHIEDDDCHARPFGIAFNNQPQLRAPESDYICNHCASLDNSLLQKYAKSVITSDGFYKFASNLDRAYWLLNPPEAPFLMIYGTQKNQHLAWYAPVNQSQEVFYVQLGYQVLRIRKSKLLEANAVAKAFYEKHEKFLFQKGKDDPEIAVRTSWLLNNEDERENKQLIFSLTQGERWAARICQTAGDAVLSHTPTQTLPTE